MPRLDDPRRSLLVAFDDYQREFGEGFDEESFVDFVVSQLLDPPDGAPGLIDWYAARARHLSNRMASADVTLSLLGACDHPMRPKSKS